MFSDLQNVVDVVKTGFGHPRTLVVGDLMLDRYVWGSVDRISPEAPVPVVRVGQRTERAGGAANVALNLGRLGCDVRVAGVVGSDVGGEALLTLLRDAQVGVESIVSFDERPTSVKTRIIGGHQQILRLDREDGSPISKYQSASLLEKITSDIAEGVSVVVLSDYGKGVLSPHVCKEIITLARAHDVPVLVDPKGHDYSKYFGVTALSPNRSELAQVTLAPSEDLEGLFAAGEKLRSALHLDFIALTLGEHGIALLEPGTVSQFPAVAREVFDVSGAGDTVIATIAASFNAGLHLHDSIRLANLAAGAVVGKIGTVPISREELLGLLLEEEERDFGKICVLSELKKRVERWRSVGDRVVFTNGCFDLLHAGHVNLLQQARSEGDRLIVGINTDRSVRALKGPKRPVIGEQQRALVLAALASVDAVVMFDEGTPIDLIHAIRPDVIVKGGDYSEDEVVGADEVRSWGGKVTIVPLVGGLSTSEVLRRVAQSAD